MSLKDKTFWKKKKFKSNIKLSVIKTLAIICLNVMPLCV